MALNFQLQFLTSRKRFEGSKNNSNIRKSKKKSIDICLLFFSESLHTIMSELNTAYFTQKKENVPHDPAGPVLMADSPIMHTYMCDPCGARHCLCSCCPAKSEETSARLGQLRSAYTIRTPSLTGAELVQAVDIWSGHFDI